MGGGCGGEEGDIGARIVEVWGKGGCLISCCGGGGRRGWGVRCREDRRSVCAVRKTGEGKGKAG